MNTQVNGQRSWLQIAQSRWIELCVVGILILLTLVFSSFTVHEGKRGVVLWWGEFQRVANPGFGWKWPIAETVVDMPVDLQSAQPPVKEIVSKGGQKKDTRHVNTYTADNQEIDVLFTIFFRIPQEKIQYVYINNRDFQPKLLGIAEDRLKAEMGKVKLEHFAEHRGEVRDRVKATIKNDAKQLGLEVTDFQLSDVEYTQAFRTAVEGASVQKAGVETQEWVRQQAEKTAQTKRINAEGEANAVREKAKGDAYSIDEVAKAEARAIRVKGEATAEAMKAQAQALSANPTLVKMEIAKRWDGAFPVWMTPGGALPLMNVDAPERKAKGGKEEEQ